VGDFCAPKSGRYDGLPSIHRAPIVQALPLDQQYTFGGADSAGTGRGVTIYTLDSGVRIAHEEFRDWPDRTPRVSYGCGSDHIESSAEQQTAV
jgi:subtilisin family serine protease